MLFDWLSSQLPGTHIDQNRDARKLKIKRRCLGFDYVGVVIVGCKGVYRERLVIQQQRI